MTKVDQIDSISISESPTSESADSKLPEKRRTISATFHDILPPHCITTADRSARAYYGQSKFIRRLTEPAASSTASSTSKIDTSRIERQKQGGKFSAVRRSTLQTMREYIGGSMSVKTSKKDGSHIFSMMSENRNRKDTVTVYEYDSDEGIGTFEEHKAL